MFSIKIETKDFFVQIYKIKAKDNNLIEIKP